MSIQVELFDLNKNYLLTLINIIFLKNLNKYNTFGNKFVMKQTSIVPQPSKTSKGSARPLWVEGYATIRVPHTFQVCYFVLNSI